MSAPLLVCLLLLLALGAAERVARDRAWRRVPIRIHVNGTRGKSTVTRLIWSALREARVPTVAKTTGTAARLLLPDGTERPLARRGQASVREQLALLRLARRSGARAVVAECMALDPGLQYVCERDMVRATIGVITNVRFDHTEIMGRDLESVAATLANTVPAGGVLVTGEPRFAGIFARRAAALGSSVRTADSTIPPPFPCGDSRSAPATGWLAEDAAIALAVTRHLGIPDDVALRGFAAAPPDPGACGSGVIVLPGGTATWTDATAANDPESLARLVADIERSRAGGDRGRILVYNHRPDRGTRLACFAERSALLADADQVVVTGARPPWTVWRRLARVRKPRALRYVGAGQLAAWLTDHGAASTIVFCGNTRGMNLPRLLEEIGSRG